MRYRYLPMTDVDDDGFGIAVLEEYGDETTVIESFADLTSATWSRIFWLRSEWHCCRS